MTTSKYTPKDVARFWSKVAITANDEKCWEWQRSLMVGYGCFAVTRNGKFYHCYGHRVAWELVNGEIWILIK